MARSQRNGLDGCEVLERHIFRRAGQLQSGDCSRERGVSARRAVAVEIGQDVHVTGQKGDIFRLTSHFTQQRIQQFINGLPLRLSLRQQGFVTRMRLNNVVD